MVLARRKAQLRADSIRIAEETIRRTAQIAELKKSTALFFLKNKSQIDQELKQTEELAYQNVETIYKMLEKNNTRDACSTFNKLRGRLAAFTCKETYATLEMTIQQIAGSSSVSTAQ
jgi:hypothetical protein